MPLIHCRSLPGRTLEGTTLGTDISAQMTASEFSPALKFAMVLGGIIALFFAMRVGRVLIKLLFGVMGFAIIGGAVWWFLLKR